MFSAQKCPGVAASRAERAVLLGQVCCPVGETWLGAGTGHRVAQGLGTNVGLQSWLLLSLYPQSPLLPQGEGGYLHVAG